MAVSNVLLSHAAAQGLEKAIGIVVTVNTENSAEKMAWVVELAKLVEDRPEFFPRGKSATIQNIERQITAMAELMLIDNNVPLAKERSG